MSMNSPVAVEVKFGDWISEGFRMFTEQWQAWVLQALVMIAALLVIVAVEYVAFFFVVAVVAAALGDSSVVLILVLLPAFLTLSMIAGSALVCGMYKSAFKQLLGGRVELGDLFSGMDLFVPVVLAQLCVGALTFVGVLFCIVPAFIVAGLFYFTLPLIIHRRLGVIDAMRTSFELAKQNLLMFTLFALVVGILVQAGSYLCYVGLLATFPLQFTIGVVAYRDCFGVPGARTFQAPPVNPASYGGQPGWPPSAGSPAWPPSAGPSGWPPSAVPPQPVYCRSCQTPMPPGAQFCPTCGATAN
jgi:uncharacterized membrane protein